MVVEIDEEGCYLQKAEGIDEKGEKCAERPLRFIADDKPHSIPDLPGLKYVTTKPDPHTMTGESPGKMGQSLAAAHRCLTGREIEDGYELRLRYAITPVQAEDRLGSTNATGLSAIPFGRTFLELLTRQTKRQRFGFGRRQFLILYLNVLW